MTRLIVVGFDGSEDAERALRWAVQVAQPAQALVRAVAVDDGEEAEAIVEAAVLRVLAAVPGTAITGEVRPGDPATELVEAARYATMLVLGSHGRSERSRTPMGSVASACTRTAVCPVVVVPGRLRMDTWRAAHLVGARLGGVGG